MDEILRDPKTTWEETRLAMKSQGGQHVTSGGVLMALATAATEALSKETDQEEQHNTAPHVVDMTAKLEDDNEGCLHCSQLDEIVPTHTNFGYMPTSRNTRKPATNNPRRGFTSQAGRGKNSANNSFNRSVVNSSYTSNTSVDMMDFGVDNSAVAYSMNTLNEIERRGTQCSSTADEDSSFPTNGFLDWNHDDESSAHTSQHDDSDEISPDKHDNTHNDDHEGAADVEVRRESWHIEDHDFEPEIMQQSVIPKMFKRLSSGTVETVSSLLSKLAVELGRGDDRCESQEATTDEVKKALSLRAKSYRLHSRDSRRASY